MLMEAKNLKNPRSFSLLELLVIISIFLLLGSLVGPKLFSRQDKVRQKAARTQIERLMVAVEAFRLDVGRYPTQEEGLAALVTNSGIDKWKGAYLKKAVPYDPWVNPYHYRNPGEHGAVDIYSYGKDNQPGGKKENADLGSWE